MKVLVCAHGTPNQADLLAKDIADVHFGVRSAGIANDDDSPAPCRHLHAGIDGIKKKIEYEPIPENIYKISEKISDLKIKKLPTNLNEALEELESDDVIKKAIGKETVDMFIKYKQKEWQQYIGETTDLEYKLYFHC